MAPRTQQHARSKTPLPPQWAAANRHAAGIDVGAAAHEGAVPPSDDPQPVRCCAASTAALEALADWLAPCQRTPGAMASPGVSWIPLFARLETRGFAGRVVDPQPVQPIKGRPTSDGHDGPWIPRRHPFGLLASAFRPTDQRGVRRSSLRQRARLLTSTGPHSQPRPKALTQRNLQ